LALDVKRELFRHLVATVAYRGGLAVSDAPENFSTFRINETTRTPGELLAHICDLLEGSLYLVKGELVYLMSAPPNKGMNRTRNKRRSHPQSSVLAGYPRR
jgi:hypothetical protein